MHTRHLSILVLIAATIAAGCASTGDRTQIRKETEVRGFDFTDYGDFLITPEGYSGQYESVGIIEITIWPEMRRRKVNSEKGGSRMTPWETTPVNPKTAVDSLYERARDLGADAIIRFDTQAVTETVDDGSPSGIQRTGVQARGFAIDRSNR